MKLMNQIELDPKNGDFVILQDARSGSWEVGRWAQETSSWVQIDGKPLRLFPTHWVPVSGDPAGSPNRLSFLVPPPPLKVTAPMASHSFHPSFYGRSDLYQWVRRF